MHSVNIDLASGIAAFEAKEFRRAMQLLSPLAEEGEAEAQFRLGIIYQTGLGGVSNESYAYRWMRESAQQGHALAQHGLGIMYLFGECAIKNEVEALKWFEKAAAQGLIGALTTMAMIYQDGLGVEPDADKAKELYVRAGFDDLG